MITTRLVKNNNKMVQLCNIDYFLKVKREFFNLQLFFIIASIYSKLSLRALQRMIPRSRVTDIQV